MAEKICSKCHILRSFDSFYNDPRSPDGKGYYCKDCIRNNYRQRKSQRQYIYIPIEKMCGECQKTKPIDDFGINRAAEDGHNHLCKMCLRERARSIRDRQKEVFLQVSTAFIHE